MINKIKKLIKFKDIIFVLTTILSFYIFVYIGMPIFNYGYIGLPFISILLGIITLLFDINKTEYATLTYKKTYKSKFGFILLIIGFIFFAILPIGSMNVFRSSEYYKLIGNVIEKTDISDLKIPNIEDAIIIDSETAYDISYKKLVNENDTLLNNFKLDKFYLQEINNKLYYISPLLYSNSKSFNGNLISGYVMLNALDTSDFKLITNVNNYDIKLKYQTGKYGENIRRHIYNNGFKNKPFTDINFTVDDNMNPWYITSLYDKKIGYSGREVTSVLIINPMNGHINKYDINNVPDWVDFPHNYSIINDQIWDWCKNDNDTVNKRKTDGLHKIFNNKKKYYYTDIIDYYGKDDVSIGFIFVDTKTKETIYYKYKGITVESSISTIENLVGDKYDILIPGIYKLFGELVYFTIIKDDNKIVKYAIVNYKNGKIIGIGDNVNDAKFKYQLSLNKNGIINNDLPPVRIKIDRIGLDIINGIIYYNFTTENYPNRIFITTSNISSDIILTEKGDDILMDFYKLDNNNKYTLKYFKNLTLNINNN
ncbi:MAG: hypothetical protein WDA02_08000 [Saccharofermentanales bacterium]